jgi:hypothetical protein
MTSGLSKHLMKRKPTNKLSRGGRLTRTIIHEIGSTNALKVGGLFGVRVDQKKTRQWSMHARAWGAPEVAG